VFLVCGETLEILALVAFKDAHPLSIKAPTNRLVLNAIAKMR
jgi:hypothetical protein